MKKKIEFPLELIPNDEEEQAIKEAIYLFMQYFNIKTPHIAALKGIIWAAKGIRKKTQGKGKYYGYYLEEETNKDDDNNLA